MPFLAVLLVRTALANLVIGTTIGALVLAAKGGAAALQGAGRWLGLHTEVVMAGWLLQFVFGVAFWMLPRFRTGAPRGDERPVWAAYVLVNLGPLLVLAGRIIGLGPAVLIPARLAEAAAAVCFAAHAWPRIKAFGT